MDHPCNTQITSTNQKSLLFCLVYPGVFNKLVRVVLAFSQPAAMVKASIGHRLSSNIGFRVELDRRTIWRILKLGPSEERRYGQTPILHVHA